MRLKDLSGTTWVLLGWQNFLYRSDGASETEYGTPVSPPADIAVDMENKTITLTFSGKAMGNPSSYEGAEVYVTTWDWDGPAAAYRGLYFDPGPWSFSGGNGEVDPLVADYVGPLKLSE